MRGPRMTLALAGGMAILLVRSGVAESGDPKDAKTHLARAVALEDAGKYAEAAAAYTKAIELDPKLSGVYQRRGLVHFKAGKIQESLADFDRYIALNPKARISHWQRGISCYYAGRFDDGRKQFEEYQTYHDADVENAVWRYLCMARSVGMAKARADLLKVGKDTRVPMHEIYELFAGRVKPADVLEAARDGKPADAELNQRLFYAHLYLGLFYETEGDAARALEHLTKAANDHRIGHYMWDVARVHRELLEKKSKVKS